jgi:hypothetical protein
MPKFLNAIQTAWDSSQAIKTLLISSSFYNHFSV